MDIKAKDIADIATFASTVHAAGGTGCLYVDKHARPGALMMIGDKTIGGDQTYLKYNVLLMTTVGSIYASDTIESDREEFFDETLNVISDMFKRKDCKLMFPAVTDTTITFK